MIRKLFLLLVIMLVAACAAQPVAPTPKPSTVTPEVSAEIVTLEPTPTMAVCTPLPNDMSLTIRYESDRNGVIEVEGLQPGEKPILLLTGNGEVSWDWWRKETQHENAVGADGRFQYKFDFRSWDSVEGYEFKGQLIHNRGVACFAIDLPLAVTAVPPPTTITETPTPRPTRTSRPTLTLFPISPPTTTLPLALDAQYGVTVTAITANFSPSATIIDTLVQVDPLWEMDPTAFPPQQALTYVTFPDSLIDDQGRTVPPTSREGETAAADPQTGGLQQLMHNHWETVPADAHVVTATMKIELLNLYRMVDLLLDWQAHQAGDVWEADVMLPIGYAAAQIRQIEWVKTLDNGRARLRFTIINASPEGFRFTCLHLDTTDPWQRNCANFDDEVTINIDLQPGEPVSLHMLAWVELRIPFQLVLDVNW